MRPWRALLNSHLCRSRSNLWVTSTLFLLLLANFDVQPLDLLIQGGERDAELLCRLGLVPVGAFELVDDYAALDVPEDCEERRIRLVLQQGSRVRTARQLPGKHI